MSRLKMTNVRIVWLPGLSSWIVGPVREVALDNLQRISLDGGSQAPKVVYGRTEVGRYFLFNVYGLSRLPNHALFGVVSLQFFFFFSIPHLVVPSLDEGGLSVATRRDIKLARPSRCFFSLSLTTAHTELQRACCSRGQSGVNGVNTKEPKSKNAWLPIGLAITLI